MPFFEECPSCRRPLTNEANLRKLRRIIIGTFLTGGILGAAALPLIGFGAAGVTAGSFAAAWQS